jgi:lipopolysaccharide transport system permease protein
MLALVLVFGKLGKMPTGGVPYPLMSFCGLLPWTFFSTALSESGQSLVTNSNLISKIYFPRLVIPAASVMTSMVDFAISVFLMIILLIWYQFVPSPNVIFIPLFVLLAFGLSFGTGLWISALMVKYRDFRFIVPFLLQFGLYVSPVPYATGLTVPEKYQLWFSLNPIVGVIDGFRWSLLGGVHALNVPGLIISIVAVVLLIATGIWNFRRTERSFADII